MKFRITLLLILLHGILMAQPGYMGKKLSLSYSLEATPFLSVYTDVYEATRPSTRANSASPFILMVFGHHLQSSYAINRKTELLVNLGFRKLVYYSAVNDYTEQIFYGDAIELSGDIGVRHFFKHFVAPIGTYHQVSFGTVQANLLDAKKMNSDPVRIFRLSYGIGLKKIIAKHLFFQCEFDYNLIMGSNSDYTIGLFGRPIDPQTVSSELYSEVVLAQNLSSYKRYNLKFGIGLII